MAHLWVAGVDGQLVERVIEGEAWDGPGLQVRRAQTETSEAWVLLADRAGLTLVNGEELPVGMRALSSRDEIRAHDGTRVVFDDEHVAHVTSFPAGQVSLRCARCTGDLESGKPSVQCPTCGSWFHEHGDYPCWTSAASCSVCGQVTGLAAPEAWTPEEG